MAQKKGPPKGIPNVAFNKGKQNGTDAGKLEDTAPVGKKGPKSQDVKSTKGKRG